MMMMMIALLRLPQGTASATLKCMLQKFKGDGKRQDTYASCPLFAPAEPLPTLIQILPWDADLDLNCTNWSPCPPVLGSVNPRLQLETSDWKECEVMHLFAMAWLHPSTNDHSSWRLSSSSPTLPKSWWPLVFLPFRRGGRAPHCP